MKMIFYSFVFLFSITTLCLANNARRFYVINSDQNKLVVADYQTFQRLSQSTMQYQFAAIKENIGKRLPHSRSLVECIEIIKQTPDAIVTLYDKNIPVIQILQKSASNTYDIKTAKQFVQKDVLKQFNTFFKTYLPEAQALLATMQPEEKKVLDLATIQQEIDTQMPLTVTESAPTLSTETRTTPEQPTITTEEQVVPAVLQQMIPSIQTPPAAPSQPVSPPEASIAPPAIPPTATAIPTPVAPVVLPSVTAATKELFLFMYNNAVYITPDKQRAIKSTLQRDNNELELTTMESATRRVFRKQNIEEIINRLNSIPHNVSLMIYNQNMTIAKLLHKPQEGITKIVYFDEANRNLLLNEFGTALRHLMKLGNDKAAFEAKVLRGSL